MSAGNGARPGELAPGLMIEHLTDDWGYFVRSARELERFRSPYQAVEVHDTVPFGKLFRLDGCFMTSEKDEFFYHENLIHMPGLTHPAPELLAYPREAVVADRSLGGDFRSISPRRSIR